MPTSAEFNDLFDSQHPRNEFETEAVYQNYRRTAWRWYGYGKQSVRKAKAEWCSICGNDHYTDEARKHCGAMYNATKNDTE